MGMERQVSEIGQIAVTVSDVDAALAFYRDILGLAESRAGRPWNGRRC
jgi:predicted enzyme related to lactoylglutathione lyase